MNAYTIFFINICSKCTWIFQYSTSKITHSVEESGTFVVSGRNVKHVSYNLSFKWSEQKYRKISIKLIISVPFSMIYIETNRKISSTWKALLTKGLFSKVYLLFSSGIQDINQFSIMIRNLRSWILYPYKTAVLLEGKWSVFLRKHFPPTVSKASIKLLFRENSSEKKLWRYMES